MRSPRQPAAAVRHVARVVILSWAMFGVHLLALVGLVLTAHDLHCVGAPLAPGTSETFQQGQHAGRVIGSILGISVHAVGAVWAPLNAKALARQLPWAWTSTLMYSTVAFLSCMCFPVGIFVLWSMSRPGVENLFRR